MHILLRSACIFCRSSTTRLSRGSARALAGSWQQRHASLHSHAPLCTSAVTLTHRSRRTSSNKRPIRRWSMLRRNVPLARCPGRLLMTSRCIQQPTHPSHHTPHNLTSPLYLPLSTCILVEKPPPQYAQRLDWVSGHHMTCISYLRRTGHKRSHWSLLLQRNTCLRSTDMDE